MASRAKPWRRTPNPRVPLPRVARRLNCACSPVAEALERRVLLSAFTVTNLADSGAGSLRDAITSANRAGGAQTINFSAGLAGTIGLQSALPEISTNLILNGPGANLLAINAEHVSGVLAFDGGVTAQLSNLTITGGFSSEYAPSDPFADGGGIRNFGTLTITGCSIVQNFSSGFGTGAQTKGGFGGGIYNSPGATLTLISSNVSNNNVANGHEEGGGICNFSGALVVINSTISGNTAYQAGAGIFSNNGITVIDSTISGNDSAYFNNGTEIGFGGGLYSLGQTTLDGDIIAANKGSSDLDGGFSASPGTFVGSNDLIGKSFDVANITSSFVDANPFLSPLAYNGGATETMALQAPSPAIGNGAVFALANAVDQRGQTRVPGSIDIGAFQNADAPGPSLIVTNLNDNGAGSLRQAILTADIDNQSDAIIFTPGLSGTINLASPLPALTANTTIKGPGAPVLTVNGNSNGSVLTVSSGAIATIENLTITGGSAAYGGGINNQSSLTVTNCDITASYASTDGGGIYSTGILTITNSTLSGNSSIAGGGLFTRNTTSITNSTLSGNYAAFAGGGIYSASQVELTISGCTISGNITPRDGAGIYSDNSFMNMTNCTLTGNLAAEGAGIFGQPYGSNFITDSTISGNDGFAGGGIFGGGELYGVIVAYNDGSDLDLTSKYASFTGSNDLIGDGTFDSNLTSSIGGTVTTPINPALGPLADNGGPTQTMALLKGSPAIGDGASFQQADGVDQRGQARPASSGIDIGAYQSGIVVTTLADPTIFLNGVISLRKAIQTAEQLGNNQIITFAPGLTGGMNLISSLPAITTHLTIAGPGVNIVTVNGQSHSPVFTINSGQTLAIQNLTVTGGSIADNGTLASLGDVLAGPITGTGALAVGAPGQYARLTLLSNTGTSTQSSLTVNSGSTLDITNNRFLINFGSPAADPIATIQTLLTTGYHGGAWTGTGIDSSTAAAGSPSETLSVGYADGNIDTGTPALPNQIVVRYTLAGDASLDGLVNFPDLVAILQNFNKGGTDWSRGNFGFGPSTSFGNLVAVLQNFNKVLTPAASSAAQLGNTTIPLAQSAAASIPTPAVSPLQYKTPGVDAPSGAATASPGQAILHDNSTNSIFDAVRPKNENRDRSNSKN